MRWASRIVTPTPMGTGWCVTQVREECPSTTVIGSMTMGCGGSITRGATTALLITALFTMSGIGKRRSQIR
ncbi:rhsD domain protein [Burkholderia pseudomallei MSHR5569]|nr:rhsD domain protein [Burkholderia pseudomallei MSHR5569]